MSNFFHDLYEKVDQAGKNPYVDLAVGAATYAVGVAAAVYFTKGGVVEEAALAAGRGVTTAAADDTLLACVRAASKNSVGPATDALLTHSVPIANQAADDALLASIRKAATSAKSPATEAMLKLAAKTGELDQHGMKAASETLIKHGIPITPATREAVLRPASEILFHDGQPIAGKLAGEPLVGSTTSGLTKPGSSFNPMHAHPMFSDGTNSSALSVYRNAESTSFDSNFSNAETRAALRRIAPVHVREIPPLHGLEAGDTQSSLLHIKETLPGGSRLYAQPAGDLDRLMRFDPSKIKFADLNAMVVHEQSVTTPRWLNIGIGAGALAFLNTKSAK